MLCKHLLSRSEGCDGAGCCGTHTTAGWRKGCEGGKGEREVGEEERGVRRGEERRGEERRGEERRGEERRGE